MPADEFLFGAELTDAERDDIREALERHSIPLAPGLNARPIEIALRDSTGKLVGGLLGSTAWDWLLIDLLWVDESCRGQGLGAELLEKAEYQAGKLGCTQARAETFDFQALPFYRQHGYEAYAALEGFPKGHTEYQLRKSLP
ncbi:MAG: GNAT family N-acetyltransferase [Gammaproteobacteria bacterium]|jgi:GNAT superfamily N-acetyltransferase|nr:GNAT family N-acetyltransferase [Gammaproteobacteria bacterium]MDP6616869.1 GNAT family N-acetyltransferase [Gammaproteobacteria bacterium]MDP6694571.1 GNAT family N-acetyltransferase [Gammaproteobacteria bacterium]